MFVSMDRRVRTHKGGDEAKAYDTYKGEGVHALKCVRKVKNINRLFCI